MTVEAVLARKLCDQHFGNENVQSTVRRTNKSKKVDSGSCVGEETLLSVVQKRECEVDSEEKTSKAGKI